MTCLLERRTQMGGDVWSLYTFSRTLGSTSSRRCDLVFAFECLTSLGQIHGLNPSPDVKSSSSSLHGKGTSCYCDYGKSSRLGLAQICSR